MAGYAVIIDAVVIAWCSQSQKTVMLSVTEDKHSKITEVFCEVLLVGKVSLFVVVVIKYPMTINVDSGGYILLL